ncbi:DUF4097 domain-containing protein [bacterium]|nr:DUF4097 domain-containing protein [bacterium]
MKYNYCVLALVIGCAEISFSATVTKEFRQNFLLQQGGDVVVENINGNISIESWDRDSVEVFAEIEVKAENRRDAEEFIEEVHIEIGYQADRLSVGPNYPKSEGGNSILDWIFGRTKPQVNIQFWIKIPSIMNLNLESVNGQIAVESVKGSSVLRTTNGTIKANRMEGSVDGETVNGSLRINISEMSGEDEVVLHTTNGNIDLILPEDIEADVEASTVNGGISTDFPLEVQGKLNNKQLRGRIHGGGSLIELNTVNGSIRINKEYDDGI